MLIIFIFIFRYEFQIQFELSTDPRANQQQFIIQLLASLIMYDDSFGLVYINLTWIIVSLVPIFIFNDFKKTYSMNLTTFFFPNFFFYVFYWRYSEIYFAASFPSFIVKTIILGLTIAIISIFLSILLKFVKNFRINTKTENLEQIKSLNRIKCPKCGTQFNSIPKYCFNCNNIIKKELGEKIGKAK